MERPSHMYTDNALRVLRDYNWPGNVRELENLIQRLVVIVDSNEIGVSDLPPNMRHGFPTGAKSIDHRTLTEVEAEHIQNVINSVAGNKTKAAEILGIDRKTLRAKCRGLKLQSTT